MGHYRGRDNRKRRAARRRRNDAVCQRGRWLRCFDRGAIDAVTVTYHFLADGMRMAAQALSAFAAGALQFMGCSLMEFAASLPGPLPPAEPITLDELRRLAGGDGATMAVPRYTSEGGFTPN